MLKYGIDAPHMIEFLVRGRSDMIFFQYIARCSFSWRIQIRHKSLVVRAFKCRKWVFLLKMCLKFVPFCHLVAFKSILTAILVQFYGILIYNIMFVINSDHI